MKWLLPISHSGRESNGKRLHLVPDTGTMVKTACGRMMVNLQFATERDGVRRCEMCLAAQARAERAAA